MGNAEQRRVSSDPLAFAPWFRDFVSKTRLTSCAGALQRREILEAAASVR